MGKCMLFFDQALKPTIGYNFKKFSFRMSMMKHQKYGNKLFAQK